MTGRIKGYQLSFSLHSLYSSVFDWCQIAWQRTEALLSLCIFFFLLAGFISKSFPFLYFYAWNLYKYLRGLKAWMGACGSMEAHQSCIEFLYIERARAQSKKNIVHLGRKATSKHKRKRIGIRCILAFSSSPLSSSTAVSVGWIINPDHSGASPESTVCLKTRHFNLLYGNFSIHRICSLQAADCIDKRS